MEMRGGVDCKINKNKVLLTGNKRHFVEKEELMLCRPTIFGRFTQTPGGKQSDKIFSKSRKNFFQNHGKFFRKVRPVRFFDCLIQPLVRKKWKICGPRGAVRRRKILKWEKGDTGAAVAAFPGFTAPAHPAAGAGNRCCRAPRGPGWPARSCLLRR